MSLKRARIILPHAHDPVDTITLDEVARHRRRVKMVSDHGTQFLLDLPEAQLLRHGQGIELEDGRVIEVVAEPEDLYEVRGQSKYHLLQLAWQLGNRHLPTQILEDRLRIRRDHVIKDMLEGLGAEVADINDSFNPEGGAYATGHHSGHHHD